MPSSLPPLVYLLCFLTSAGCAFALLRNYGRTGMRLLLWTGLCFGLLAANNLVVIFDVLVLADQDFSILRLGFSLAAVMVLLFGFVWDLDE